MTSRSVAEVLEKENRPEAVFHYLWASVLLLGRCWVQMPGGGMLAGGADMVKHNRTWHCERCGRMRFPCRGLRRSSRKSKRLASSKDSEVKRLQR
mmetsp:Transcript_124142/g.397332  ORF Transcript_124142/g.397332 Transcript_124142/m.397332 type:complete len:95 (-) Transcript_124142:390-674(-)